MEDSDRQALLDLIRAEAVLRGRFVLSSGRESSYYIDARRVTLSSAGSRLVGRVIWSMIASDGCDAVAGLTLGADPIVTAVSLTSSGSAKPVDGLIVRKEVKAHGTGKQIEGPLRDGMTAVVVEDTSTTGQSALQAVHFLADAGVRVDRVVTLIDREEGARSAIEGAGLRFDSVCTVSEITADSGEAATTALPPAPRATKRRLLLKADGSSIGNPGPSGAGYLLFDEQLNEVRRGSEPLGIHTNNVAEYEALIRGMKAALAEGAVDLVVRMDSELVIRQMRSEWRVKHPNLRPLFSRAQEVASRFSSVMFEQIPRELNQKADQLATKASRLNH